jgi:hypothetical protein
VWAREFRMMLSLRQSKSVLSIDERKNGEMNAFA